MISFIPSYGRKVAKMCETGRKLAKKCETGRKLVKSGEKWVILGENVLVLLNAS